MAEQSTETDQQLLSDYTRWLFDKQDITKGRFDHLVADFLSDREPHTRPAEEVEDG